MKKMILTFVLSFVLLNFISEGQNCDTSNPPVAGDVCTFNSSGTFTVLGGYTATITVEAWGGGGAGGDSNGNGDQGGGGGGSYARSQLSFTGSASVTVGAGGIPTGVKDGGDSFFGADLVRAIGGKTPISQGTSGGAGGTGGFGSILISGGTGGSGASNEGGGGGGSGGSQGTGGVGGNGGDGGTAGGEPGAAGAGGAGTGSQNGGALGGRGGADGSAGSPGAIPGGGGGGKGRIGGIVSGEGGAGLVIVTVNSVLPIELINFSSSQIENAVNLSWQTATELNNEKFIIEHSADGRNYSAIGEVKGAGTTLEEQTYLYIHKAPVRGKNYYRLQQVDFDGQYAHSHVESVEFDKEGKMVAIFPTATNGKLNIQSVEENRAAVKVYDLTGAQIISQTFIASNNMEIDLSAYSNGIYIVTVEMDGQLYRERVLKF